ncbi:MAG: hypothetical protein ACRCZF_13170 [Gemmataceae bacterium]
MTLTDFYNEVARQADTDTLKIGAADTKRVLATMFSLLAAMDAAEATELIAKGLTTAKKKAEK